MGLPSAMLLCQLLWVVLVVKRAKNGGSLSYLNKQCEVLHC